MLLRRLKAGGHKALIFTQMTRMLDVLEAFLNLHGHTYLRLDGSTKPEMRQARPCPNEVMVFHADMQMQEQVMCGHNVAGSLSCLCSQLCYCAGSMFI